MVDLVETLLPAYRAEGKSYLTIAMGCTGGRHRSVVLADELAHRLGRRRHGAIGLPPGHRPVTGSSRPRVVAVGGGHGLAASLRAARLYAGTVTAIVSVADDGGSSGRLRRQMGIVPPGDLRTCLVALADDDTLLARVFEQRFDSDADELTGHALGNLVLAGLMAAAGDVQLGLDEAARLLGAGGRVIPAATEPVVLKASSEDGDIEGQTAVQRTPHIQRVSVIPADAVAPAPALAALAEADQIVVGPGSLFTSVLAALAVPGIAEGIRRAERPHRLRGQPPPPAGRDGPFRRGRPRGRPPGPRHRRGHGGGRHHGHRPGPAPGPRGRGPLGQSQRSGP